MEGLLSGWTRKDLEQLPNFFFQLRIEMLNVLYILQLLTHNNIMAGLLLGWNRKDITQMHNFFFRVRIKMLNVLYILEALRHNNIMAGLLDGRTRKDLYLGEPERIYNNSLIFFFRLRIEMFNVLYILETLRHNNIMQRLLPGWARKDIEQLPNFFFFGYGSKCLACYICYMRSGIVTSFQDFYLGKRERT